MDAVLQAIITDHMRRPSAEWHQCVFETQHKRHDELQDSFPWIRMSSCVGSLLGHGKFAGERFPFPNINYQEEDVVPFN